MACHLTDKRGVCGVFAANFPLSCEIFPCEPSGVTVAASTTGRGGQWSG